MHQIIPSLDVSLRYLGVILLCLSVYGCDTQTHTEIQPENLPSKFQKAIKNISLDTLGNAKEDVQITEIDSNTVHIKIKFELTNSLTQNDWQVNIIPKFKPDFNWAPHLTPDADHVIDQHVFRAPALIGGDEKQLLIIIPDIDLLNGNPPVNWYMDMDAPNNIFTLGMSNTEVAEHVLFKKTNGAKYTKGTVEYGFYLLNYTDKKSLENPFHKPLSFFWDNWGGKLFKKGDPISSNLMPYVEQTYHWAFNSWKNQVWQEFELDGKPVGAPTFIVNVTQSPNYPGEVNEREFRSVWNQAWFNSLRSASGLYRYAKREGDKELMKKANLTKELALSFPKKEGFFYGLIGTEMETIKIDGKEYNRSKGWDHYFWGNSNRNPFTGDPKESPFHILDMSWTALLMLRWYDELDADERLLKYAEDYGQSLLKVQTEKGFFPGWLDIETLEPKGILDSSPETSMSVSFLLKLYELTENEEYKEAALKAMDAVTQEIIPEERWEDFETYWSCSRIGSEDWVNQKVQRNNMFKQNNFSMYWTAEALLESYNITKDNKYLALGQKTLDELLMTQQTWQPNFIPIKALGGFGVLNADGEWNDARQSLFSELIIRYGLKLKELDYLQRGVAAIRASFVMMYSPENPETKKQWEKAWPFFGKEDYGFMMENYGHDGRADTEGLGIGEFTIYDWGNGAAAEAYNRLIDHFGKDFIYDENARRKAMQSNKN